MPRNEQLLGDPRGGQAAQQQRSHLGNHVRRLCDDGALTQQQAAQWWSPLGQQASSGDVLAGATLILVVASKS
jgi:hypothetical protein